MSGCDRRGVLSRSGTAQPDRDPIERDVGHFKLDERDSADMILFARRFARHIRYYDPTNVAAGDWQAWFDTDISAILASLAKLPVDPMRATMAEFQAFLEDDPARSEDDLRSHFNALLHMPLTLFREAAGRQAMLSSDDPLWPVLQQLVSTEIEGPLAALASYHKGAVAEGLIPASQLDPVDYVGTGPRLTDQVANILLQDAAFSNMDLAPRAIVKFAPTGWPDFHTSQPANITPFADGADAYGQIYDALNHNLLVSVIEQIFRAIARIRAEAASRLTRSLEDFAEHTPHYALWLAFISMFDKARAELNDFTGRHLDFYYAEILRLSRRAPVADHVHVTFGLAKSRDAHLVPAGTQLRAGKDDLGIPVVYATEEDLVVNRATVADLRAVRIDTWHLAGKEYSFVRASPVVASLDGAGEEDLPDEAPDFAPFGPDTAPFGRMGFALADRQLFLREGDRKIVVEIAMAGNLAGGSATLGGMIVRLTAEEDWLEIPASASVSGGLVTLEILLTGDAPPIIAHDPDVHEGPYPSDVPVMEVVFDFDNSTDAAARSFARLRTAVTSNMTLQTEATGLRLMSIRTPDGTADPVDSFAPFGVRPRAGAKWIIGSSEVFAKRQSTVTLNVGWAEPYTKAGFFVRTNPSAYTIDFEHLSAGKWVKFEGYQTAVNSYAMKMASEAVTDGGFGYSAGSGGASGDFVDTIGKSPLGIDNVTAAIAVTDLSTASSNTELVLEEPSFGADSTSGFMRISLNRDFGHGDFLDFKTLRLIEASKEGAGEATDEMLAINNFDTAKLLPLDPYSPEITSIKIDYVSRDQNVTSIWHIHPFGSVARPVPGPVLDPTPFEGALFVGLADLDPPERLSLLFAIADGTGHPLVEAPELKATYLSDDAWSEFEDRDIDDRTDDLAGSGMVLFAMPRAADPARTAMPVNLHWLRIAAPENAAAVNRILSVHTQAMRATFVDQGNDPAFLETQLEPETIAKLLVPDRAIKTIAQPYGSFGGRGLEDRTSYHRRVSERLRHKDRALTMWDYEHLSLEAFPNLYRVKTLNTTALQRTGGIVVADNEVAPGHVTVVAVPFTRDRDPLDPLRPFTDRATLSDLDSHLRRRVSPFVQLETANPKFEEIHVAMEIAFLPHIADIDFYRDQVQVALIAHLTPWRQDDTAGVEFGGLVYKSTIIDFVEELPYVDYLENVRMYHKPNPQAGSWTKVDAEIARAATARSVLVSASTHEIEVLS